jgi:predicted ATP-dependent endonuclease of OLD family
MISHLIIRNFRSIENVDIKLGSINAFVGPNNSGKSNIMAALNLILGETYPSIRSFDDKDFHNYDKSRHIEIEVKFAQPLTANPQVLGFHLDYDDNTCNYVATDQSGNTLTWQSGREIRVSNDMRREVSLMYLGLNRQAYQQIRVTRWTVYGKLLKYIERTIDATKRERFKSEVEHAYETNIAPDLSVFIDGTRGFIKKQTGLDLDFRLSTIDPIETLKNLRPYFQEPGISIKFDAENVGAGVQSALAVAIARAYAEIVRGSLLMAIEEPELYLHPHGCRHFYKLLCELSRNGVQIVYTTHERSLVNVIDYQNVHLVRKRNGKTYARSGIELSLPPSETIKIASKFDDMMNEIFFANRVILVEGFADRIAAQLALEKEDTDIDKENISITECGGRGAIKDIATIIKHFDIPVYIIVDEDPQNPIAQRENQGLISLVGKDNVFLQRPNLEGVFGLQKKPKKNEALNIFPSWFEQNEIPQLYMDLKERIFGG